ncbi:substrate-binding domain-containing protein [Pseudoroseomonas wenyumeiae]
MLQAGRAPSALLCATDRLAVGALRAAAQAGLRVGHDLAVIGYDNLPVATYTDPPLTTFDPDVEHSALRMVEMLLELLRGASPAGMAELRQARLIVRASDGPAPDPHTTTGNKAGANRRKPSMKKAASSRRSFAAALAGLLLGAAAWAPAARAEELVFSRPSCARSNRRRRCARRSWRAPRCRPISSPSSRRSSACMCGPRRRRASRSAA